MTQRKSTNRPARVDLPVRKPTDLLAEVRGMILEARKGVARAVDSGLTSVRRVRQDILKEKRAEYGGQIVAAVRRQLGWTHFKVIIPMADPLKRDFYAEMCRIKRWNTRMLEKKINSMLFERTAPSRKPVQEHFLCATINGANEILNIRVVSIGLIDRSPVHPREVFADALSDRASAVIVAHNHPSGGLEPSPSDINITAQLKAAGAIVGIDLLDHIIFNRTAYFSFLEDGRL